MSLKIKAIQAFLWNLLQTFSIQGVNFIVSIILARLLLPEDFGLIALYSIVLGISYVIVDSGMGTSLIRDKESTKEDYSIVFFFNVIVALIVYLKNVFFPLYEYYSNYIEAYTKNVEIYISHRV